MKLEKIGKLEFKKFSTEVYANEGVAKKLKSMKVSESTLIPTAWVFYESELFDVIDENGDGKPDEKFGKNFKIIYSLKSEGLREYEKEALIINKITLSGKGFPYVVIKN